MKIDYSVDFKAYHFKERSIHVPEEATPEDIKRLILEDIRKEFLNIKTKTIEKAR